MEEYNLYCFTEFKSPKLLKDWTCENSEAINLILS